MSTKQLSAVFLVLGGVILIGVVAYTLVPLPTTITEDVNEATVFFQLRDNKVLTATSCRTARWRVENIQAVFVNDEATVGEATRTYCDSGEQVTLTVQFLNGDAQTFSLAHRVLADAKWYMSLVAAGLLLLLVAGVLRLSVALPDTMGGGLRLLRAFEVAVIWLLVTALLLEGGFRGWVMLTGSEQDRLVYFGSAAELQAARTRYVELPFLMYAPSPMFDDVNSMGFRNPEFPLEKPADEYRIVAVGGSTTFGDNIPADTTWPAALEALLNAEYPDVTVRVVNAGVAAYTSWHSLVNFQFRLLELNPDMVIVYHATNDRLWTVSIPPACYRGENLNLGMTFVPDFRNIASGQLPRSAFVRFVLLRTGRLQNPLTFQNQLAQAGSVDFERRCPGVDVMGNDNIYDHDPVYFERNVASIVHLAQQNDVVPLLSTWVWRWNNPDERPPGSFYTYIDTLNERIRQVAAETDADLVPLSEEWDVVPEHFQSDAVHQTPAGTRVQARIYADYIIENAFIPSTLGTDD